ncbi:hypothetical protein NM688_g8414 [Phlebia brevispora]|uniref:Uncharacterized protein n=1 Tax=Phlebia brevispora TaxID=194682 RepID=A0ACC1RUF8_9APHY|nr:hypothetical protein NM688_g8414 [Phlebia brevispora]
MPRGPDSHESRCDYLSFSFTFDPNHDGPPPIITLPYVSYLRPDVEESDDTQVLLASNFGGTLQIHPNNRRFPSAPAAEDDTSPAATTNRARSPSSGADFAQSGTRTTSAEPEPEVPRVDFVDGPITRKIRSTDIRYAWFKSCGESLIPRPPALPAHTNLEINDVFVYETRTRDKHQFWCCDQVEPEVVWTPIREGDVRVLEGETRAFVLTPTRQVSWVRESSLGGKYRHKRPN